MRKMFTDLEDAKKEALFVAQRIQSGMQHVTDLKPHERDSFKAAEALLEKLGIPLYAAVEDYVRARTLAGTESLSAMAAEYGKPQALTWNMGTTGKTQSRALMLSASGSAPEKACRMVERWLYNAALGLPVVPLV